ncbi:unnamed protein product [Medioppia subpectinata]|uniref:Uncharacterized protein n=1 Tax=Medioppia subpectinata TaxID=1979941 RepID=A0A7R9QNH0_9ACAR|nr:unnamed protein product [Medioppia subpectinata]CAG2123375.1 unnamed protein product [Medioppia subpectinata]
MKRLNIWKHFHIGHHNTTNGSENC